MQEEECRSLAVSLLAYRAAHKDGDNESLLQKVVMTNNEKPSDTHELIKKLKRDEWEFEYRTTMLDLYGIHINHAYVLAQKCDRNLTPGTWNWNSPGDDCRLQPRIFFVTVDFTEEQLKRLRDKTEALDAFKSGSSVSFPFVMLREIRKVMSNRTLNLQCTLHWIDSKASSKTKGGMFGHERALPFQQTMFFAFLFSSLLFTRLFSQKPQKNQK